MQYMLLIYEDEAIFGDNKDNPALQEIVGKHMAFAQSLGDTLKGGAGLKPTAMATTVRTSGGAQTIHDGPFAETKEQLGGYYLVDVPNLDAAMEIARKIPLAKDGSIEIRPLLGADDGAA
ncbi:MAG TPA: YciI family protein [Allosphingosinicella sp.]|uniref:YciI family protein n=1 Tax=Allosphingosinicella sp. TaxID=2823234 RepID=UPI002EDAC372